MLVFSLMSIHKWRLETTCRRRLDRRECRRTSNGIRINNTSVVGARKRMGSTEVEGRATGG